VCAYRTTVRTMLVMCFVTLQILLEHGGVYADVDYEFVRPLDDICSRCSLFVGRANTGAVVEVNNGLIGSVA
jgi:mannosyltransferase OCH1-like enzyme